MRFFFLPAGSPPGVKQILDSIRAALADPFDWPIRLWKRATADYPTYSQAEHEGAIFYDDTLNRLATQFGVSGESIMRASGLSDPNLLLPGQVLNIPRESGFLYRVQPGEPLVQIAARFGTTTDDLVQAGLLSSATVRPGDLIFIPNRLLSFAK